MSVPEQLRVGIDVSALPDQLTGAGHYVVELIGALARRDDVALTAFARRDDTERWRTASLGQARLVGCAPRFTAARVAFGEVGLGLVAERRGDIEVFHGPHYSLPRLCKLPMAVTVHDLTLLDYPEWHERRKVLFFAYAIRRALRVASAIVCLSDADAGRVAERFAPTGAIFVVPHGVDHERFAPREPTAGYDDAALARLGVTRPYVVHVGTIEPRKNLPVLVRAFDRVAARDGAISLVLAGTEGWGSVALDDELRTTSAASRVVRLGYVADLDVPVLFRNAAAVAYPSSAEGFGMPVLEALATGAPVVTTEHSVMDELAGGTALTVRARDHDALADALTAALAGGPEVARRRREGIARAGEFTWAKSAAGHVRAWSEARSRAAATT